MPSDYELDFSLLGVNVMGFGSKKLVPLCSLKLTTVSGSFMLIRIKAVSGPDSWNLTSLPRFCNISNIPVNFRCQVKA